MLAGPIAGSVEILAELRHRGIPLYGLTNWSRETYPAAFERFAFLSWFRGILVSGEVEVIKPDPRIFALLECSIVISAASEAPRSPTNIFV
jgi:2-haloacid dehalogenase